MNTASKSGYAIAVVAFLGAVSALKSAHADPPVPAPKPLPVASMQLNCAGETGFRIEVERSRDVRVSMSRLVGASSWNTQLTATGRVATLEHVRQCNSANTTVQITADDPDARSALQTCALMGASLAQGQRMVMSVRVLDGARVGAGGNSVLLSKAAQIDCGVE